MAKTATKAEEPKEPKEPKAPKKCRTCGMYDGPYPNGDRPKSNQPLQSGCPRCGWCY